MKNSKSFPLAKFTVAFIFLLFTFGFNAAQASQQSAAGISNDNPVEFRQGTSENKVSDKGRKTKKKKKKKGHRCEAY